MDGTFVTSVQRRGADVGISRRRGFSVAVRSAFGPMNAKCVTIQSCKGFVYLYMVMGKINH